MQVQAIVVVPPTRADRGGPLDNNKRRAAFLQAGGYREAGGPGTYDQGFRLAFHGGMFRYFGLPGKSPGAGGPPLGERCIGRARSDVIEVARTQCSLERAFRRGESDVGFAWCSARDGLRVAVRIPNVARVPAESIVSACELREINNTLTTIPIKQGEV
jgi:hypothetical protein